MNEFITRIKFRAIVLNKIRAKREVYHIIIKEMVKRNYIEEYNNKKIKIL